MDHFLGLNRVLMKTRERRLYLTKVSMNSVKGDKEKFNVAVDKIETIFIGGFLQFLFDVFQRQMS